MKVVIDERAFRDLVAGKVIRDRRAAVEIILSDMDWMAMMQAILDAHVREEPQGALPPLDPPEAVEFLSHRKRRR